MRMIFKLAGSFLRSVRRDLERPHPFAAERVGFISARAAASSHSLILIAEGYHPVADTDYLDDMTVGALMGPDAIRKALDVALLQPVGMFHVHIHDHKGRPRFSPTDTQEQHKFVPDFFTVRPSLPHGAIVLSRDRFVGRVWLGPKTVSDITEFCVVGPGVTVDRQRTRQGLDVFV